MSSCEIIGVLHLLPLPGDPKGEGHLERLIQRAIEDAHVLFSSGIRRAVLENFGDAPFWAESVPPHVPAMMAVVAAAVIKETGLRLGINVLRNDAQAALGVAAATGADFIRVNVHTGAAWSDQGLIVGRAAETLLYRRTLGIKTEIAADIKVKHAVPAGTTDVVQLAKEAFFRGGADKLILTGEETGGPCDIEEVRILSEALQGYAVPLWLGSGVTPDNIGDYLPYIDGAIVGTYFHEEGKLDRPLCRARVQHLLQCIL